MFRPRTPSRVAAAGTAALRVGKAFLLAALLPCSQVFVAVATENTGEQVVVVFNRQTPGSKAVADHYAELRSVPKAQVFGFEMTTREEMSRSEYEDTLQKPLAKALESGKLWKVGRGSPVSTNDPAGSQKRVVESKIRYVVLCYGVPYKIAPAPDLREDGDENQRSELKRNEAAVDTELALLPLVAPRPRLAGVFMSPLFGATNAAELHPTNGVLMVTRVDGPSESIAQGLVDKAMQAEKDGLWGRAYIDLRGITDPSYKSGDDMLRRTADMCRLLGFETTVDTNAATFPTGFPMSDIAFYAGWYDENISGPLSQPKVEFMTGAFGYHLHSFSASQLRSTNRSWVGPLLARGLTVSMGPVYEPYLSGTPDIAVLTERLLYSGFTFGEAAYASQSVLSWQTTVVGDPLYRPAGRNPDELRAELEQRDSPLTPWTYVRLINVNLLQGRPTEAAAIILEQLERRKKSVVLSEKLGDLYVKLGKPSSADYMYQQALSLNPTPGQRVRLRLLLADRFAASGRKLEAVEQLKKLLSEVPDYADKAWVEKRLAELQT